MKHEELGEVVGGILFAAIVVFVMYAYCALTPPQSSAINDLEATAGEEVAP